MKVYVLIQGYDYEGSDVLGVYATLDYAIQEAIDHCDEHEWGTLGKWDNQNNGYHNTRVKEQDNIYYSIQEHIVDNALE